MKNSTATTHYDRKTIALHWASAAIVLLLWIAGEFLDLVPRGTPRVTVRSLHISLGLLLGFVLVYRIWWRSHGGVRFTEDAGARYTQAARTGHRVLYAVMALMVLTGIALVWIRGDNLFNLVTVAAFDPSNKELRHNAREVHSWIANTLLAAAVLHGAMAAWHHMVLKDGILRRMLPQ